MDASERQIAQAPEAAGVRWVVGSVEDSGLEAGSVDLTTAAQAVHWFDFDRYWAEVARVSKPGAIVAVWCAWQARVGHPVDAVWERFTNETVGPYWPPERRWVKECYESLPFPFEEIEAPPFEMRADWTMDQMIGYMSTWSAVRGFREATGGDPVAGVREEMAAAWGDPDRRRRVAWPIHLRLGRTSAS